MAQMLSTKEVAKFLGINEKMVYTLISEKGLPASKVTGKWIFPRHLVEQWVESSTVNFPQNHSILPPYEGLLVVTGSNDILLEKDGEEFLYFPIYNYTDLNYSAVHEMMSHPQALMGLSDGGAHVGTVCDASFPTYLLCHWTRDRTQGPKIALPRAVQMLTADIADYVGFHDRGRLKVGQKANINVIDHKKLRLHPPHMVQDLPAGGQRLLQEATGYIATIVDGVPVVENDRLTGALPGRLVRLGQKAA